jgi:putative nucleotidyltransferase with HDIG domain
LPIAVASTQHHIIINSAVDNQNQLRQPGNASMMILATRALTILHEWVQSESLLRHCYAVADSMRHFAQLRGADGDLWEVVGLLHDMNYERHPNHEQGSSEGHSFVEATWLREHGWSEGICHAILAHASKPQFC